MSTKSIAQSTSEALKNFNSDYGTGWSLGTNFSNVNTQYETFVNKYLFPKIMETYDATQELGNRFEWLAKEVDFVGQYSEEYVIADSVPVGLNLSKPAEMMLMRNYPTMITKLYNTGIVKKQKFTLNNNDTRLNFLTLGDAVRYAVSVFRKKVSDINVAEEQEMKAMIVDYATNHAKEHRKVASMEELETKIFESLLNLQNNSSKYNEADKASGGTIGRYTTVTNLNDVAILTTDSVKTHLLDTKIANSFNIEGQDFSSKIISFDDLGGAWRLTEDVTITTQATVDYFRTFGDYQIEKNDILAKGTVILMDPSALNEFKKSDGVFKFEEIKPKDDYFAYLFDINKIRYKRYTKDMLKEPFYNGEFDEVTHWIHYYSTKSVSPFYNSILVTGA